MSIIGQQSQVQRKNPIGQSISTFWFLILNGEERRGDTASLHSLVYKIVDYKSIYSKFDQKVTDDPTNKILNHLWLSWIGLNP